MIEAANLITEMKEVKHPFNKGYQARKGIEYWSSMLRILTSPVISRLGICLRACLQKLCCFVDFLSHFASPFFDWNGKLFFDVVSVYAVVGAE